MAGKLQKGRGVEISDVKALQILRSGINPNKKENEVDWELIGALAQEHGDPPKGSFTLEEYANHFNTTQARARTRLRHLIDRGQMKTSMFRRDGRLQRFYWTETK